MDVYLSGLPNLGLIVRHARQEISNAARGTDALGAVRAGAEFLAQIANMHINAAVERVRMSAVDAEGKLFARDYRPSRTREQRQQIKLRRGRFDHLSSAMHNTRAIIEVEIAEGNPFGGRRFTGRLDGTVTRPA